MGGGEGNSEDRWNIPILRRKVRPTPSEQILWQHIRGRKLAGIKFRRQQTSDPSSSTSAPSIRLIIEVDGPVHDALQERERDAARQQLIERLGFRFIRVRAADVEHNTKEVLQQIEKGIMKMEMYRN